MTAGYSRAAVISRLSAKNIKNVVQDALHYRQT